MTALLARNQDIDSSNGAYGPEEAHLGADDIGWQALAPALACSIFATIVVAARWYSRCRLTRCVGVDDYVILLSLVSSIFHHRYPSHGICYTAMLIRLTFL